MPEEDSLKRLVEAHRASDRARSARQRHKSRCDCSFAQEKEGLGKRIGAECAQRS
jgi:hypothetical protein